MGCASSKPQQVGPVSGPGARAATLSLALPPRGNSPAGGAFLGGCPAVPPAPANAAPTCLAIALQLGEPPDAAAASPEACCRQQLQPGESQGEAERHRLQAGRRCNCMHAYRQAASCSGKPPLSARRTQQLCALPPALPCPALALGHPDLEPALPSSCPPPAGAAGLQSTGHPAGAALRHRHPPAHIHLQGEPDCPPASQYWWGCADRQAAGPRRTAVSTPM